MTEKLTVAEILAMSKKKKPRKSGSSKHRDGALSSLMLALTQMGVVYGTEYYFHPERKWRFDLAIPDLKIAVEYEGVNSAKSRHTGIVGYTEDTNKYNAAQMLGWRVLRYTAINSGKMIGDVISLIESQGKQ